MSHSGKARPAPRKTSAAKTPRLSFFSAGKGAGGTARKSFWSVTPTGQYYKDVDTGERHAHDLLSLLHRDFCKGRREPVELATWTLLDAGKAVSDRGKSGVEVGLFQGLARYALAGFASMAVMRGKYGESR